jgi:uncharacterized protein (TIGR02246 family)
METDEQQIRRLMEDWRRRTVEGDLEAVLALMTDDAVFLTCGNPPMTKRDFAEGFSRFAGRIRIETGQEIKDIHASGDVAYAWSYISVVITFMETGSKTERAGHVLTVFRKSPPGTWPLARDANLMAAGTPEKA